MMAVDDDGPLFGCLLIVGCMMMMILMMMMADIVAMWQYY